MSERFANILAELQKELKKADTAANRINYQRFFKEKLKEPVGLKAPALRGISKDVYRRFGLLPEEVLDCGDYLLASGKRYMRFYAFEWAIKIERHYRPTDFKRFEGWLERYVEGWGSCDHLCCGAIGRLLAKYPELVSRTYRWRKSKNQWFRRASAVSLIVPVRKGKLFEEIVAASETMLLDPEDLVQKGYGWALKEASKCFENEVFEFVMARRDRMPRTALRYAIEKFPAKRKAECMKRVEK
jgi:3-methyladenine DNA glycosylase AlkD